MTPSKTPVPSIWVVVGLPVAAYRRDRYRPVRDANRLHNGNTLITAAKQIIEVTAEGEIVWQLTLNADFGLVEAASRGFYKAERIDPEE